MEIEQENIFGFPEPETLHSTVWMYRVHMPVMVIRVSKPNDDTDYVSLFFENPIYFQGRMRWQGARFDLATAQECDKFFLQVTGVTNLDSSVPQRLYVVNTGIGEGDDALVKILAMDVHISTQHYTIGDFFA